MVKYNFLLFKFFLFAAALVISVSCKPQESAVSSGAEKTGSLQITVNNIEGYNFSEYKASLNSKNNLSKTESWERKNQSEIIFLLPGLWTVEIDAKDENNLTARGGLTDFMIKEGELKTITVSLKIDEEEPGDREEPGDEEDPGDGEEPGDQPDDNPMLTLSAAAASGSAYSVIQNAGFDYESPSQTGGGHQGEPHIIQQYDEALKKNVFAFITHHAVDRNATGDWTRQRVEIKIDHRKSPGRDFCGLGGADEGRSFIHRWKFKLPSDFAVSNQFTHIHQIKNEGGDASQPVAALTARANSSSDRRMQLTYYAPSSSSPVYWVNAPNSLNDYLGQWVQCEERIIYSSDSSKAFYSFKITRISDNQILMDFTSPSNIFTWREGNTHGRPKFGVYRRIFTGSNPGNNIEPDSANAVSGLKDETVLFADFEIERLK